MNLLSRALITCCLIMPIFSSYAACTNCCTNMGGLSYCDSSSGRYVCKNGEYSSCYCTRHAVMGLQKLQGCCLWQGGVFRTNEMGLVICNNGGVSETCSLQSPKQRASL